MAIELVTFAQLDNILGLEGTVIADYPGLEEIQTSVTSAIEEFIGRDLEQIERTETVFINGSPTQMISLRGLPVGSIDTVTMASSSGEISCDEWNDYEVTEYGIRLFAATRRAKLTIVYTGGIATVPSAINRAALIQTVYEFQNKEHIGAESVSTDGGFVSTPSLQLLGEVKRVLAHSIHPLGW